MGIQRSSSFVLVVVLCSAVMIADAAPAADAAGELTLPNGEQSRVPFESLDFTGVARYVWSDGRSYAGDFAAGKPHGHGTELLPDGSTYDGNWVDGSRHGSGTAMYADGSRYDGAFEMGVRSGQGLFQSAIGRYQGNWADDAPQGEGRLDYADGASYEGAWLGGQRSGFGVYVRPDGSRYDGDWQDDVPDGFGHLAGADSGTYGADSGTYGADAATYDGGWRGGQRSGYGAAMIGEGFAYEGTWVANARQGYGRERRGEAGEYTGQWRADERSGQGILHGPHGSFCDGSWAHNVPTGPGTCRSDAGVEITGIWNGDLAANGVIKLRGGATYEGDLYDPTARSVDPRFLAWLERMADDGDPTAALLLGDAYRNFEDPAPDPMRASIWLSRAAVAGLAQAQYALAQLTFEQSGLSERVLELLTSAAAQGNGAANNRLGLLYQQGGFVEKDHAQARRCYEAAMAQGDPSARINLAWLLATSPRADVRDGRRAVALVQPLAVMDPSSGHLDTLAAALAEAGDYAAAARTERAAIALDNASGTTESLQAFAQRLTLFERNHPYREP